MSLACQMCCSLDFSRRSSIATQRSSDPPSRARLPRTSPYGFVQYHDDFTAHEALGLQHALKQRTVPCQCVGPVLQHLGKGDCDDDDVYAL